MKKTRLLTSEFSVFRFKQKDFVKVYAVFPAKVSARIKSGSSHSLILAIGPRMFLFKTVEQRRDILRRMFMITFSRINQ